jgi:hypothetical protein
MFRLMYLGGMAASHLQFRESNQSPRQLFLHLGQHQV